MRVGILLSVPFLAESASLTQWVLLSVGLPRRGSESWFAVNWGWFRGLRRVSAWFAGFGLPVRLRLSPCVWLGPWAAGAASAASLWSQSSSQQPLGVPVGWRVGRVRGWAAWLSQGLARGGS